MVSPDHIGNQAIVKKIVFIGQFGPYNSQAHMPHSSLRAADSSTIVHVGNDGSSS